MSSGEWRQAWQWNRGGPVLYTFFWLWLLASGTRIIRAIKVDASRT
jgi:hypothetical protein